MRAHKAEKYKELKENGDQAAFDELFLNYKPGDLINKKSDGVNAAVVRQTKKKIGKNGKKGKKAVSKRKTKKAKQLAIYGGKTARRR
jgi:hypothetical protein